ncbi:MAG: ATP-binding protein [Heteroscytonema crispum UTEX LB 1556]
MKSFPKRETEAVATDCLAGGGEMGLLMRSLDWSQTLLGPVSQWRQSLRTATSIVLNSRYPMVIWWGAEYAMIYNDAYRPILGAKKHPQFLGNSGKECWAEIWDVIGPMMDSVFTTGEATWSEDLLLIMDRNGYLEETYFTFSYSPVRDESGGIGGVFCACTENTQRVLSDRRLRTLRELAQNTAEAKTVEKACGIACEALSQNPADIPFALLYLVENNGKQARLAGTVRIPSHTAASPLEVDLTLLELELQTWHLAEVKNTGKPLIVDITGEFGELPGGIWQESPDSALVMPITQSGFPQQLAGFLIAGISPRREFDDDYRGFFDLVAANVATAIANTSAYEAERQRAEALAEIDRAKTAFFSNVSHEFRTPLTLMLSPVEEILNNSTSSLNKHDRVQLEMVHRNSLRLLKLVNSLLDFSRIEAGRVQAVYQPTDLAALTGELASVFRSAVEGAGLKFIVDCPPLGELIYVDVEMWEKIVLNLLSNALKFTFVGQIAIKLELVGDRAILTVSDTGTGIPASELPHLFKRFHRVQGMRSRTHEGSGIGLALVQELVKLHGGTVGVSSVEGQGTTFTVAIPTDSAHLPPERIGGTRTLASTALGTAPYLEEALRWSPGEERGGGGERGIREQGVKGEQGEITKEISPPPPLSPSRILLADDNADMRDYVKRLLSSVYKVEAVGDGIAALAAARENLPDLVLSDVMMPGLDGFELLGELRADPRTREVPVILLSARAGEESRVEGLDKGADDYLIKPFSARELLARVNANLEMARLRQESARRIETERAFLEEVLQQMPAGIIIAEAPSGKMVLCNQQVAEILRHPILLAENVKEYNLFKCYHSDGRPYELHEYQLTRAIAFGEIIRGEEVGYLCGDGIYRTMYANAAPIRDRSGKIIAGVCTFIDISDRKKAEVERDRLLLLEQAAREAAETASRLKDEFLSVLSHEVRTPLNAIMGWAQLLSKRKFDEATIIRGINIIKRNAKAQLHLLEDILDVSRIVRGKLQLNVQPINLCSVIEEAIETVQPAIEAKKIQLEKVYEPQACKIAGDCNRLQQVVWNLLSNAAKFTPEGGKVEIYLEKVDSHAQIRVKDTGIGIRAEFLPYVFERFRQADGGYTRSHGGLGLGLAIVRHLVELHGGTVKAESLGEGQGATFIVNLPFVQIAEKPPESNDLASETQHLSQSIKHSTSNFSGLQVLVVEDETDARELVTTILEEYGAEVIAAGSANEALNVLANFQPHVLLSDIGMPEKDGYMLIREIRAMEANKSEQLPAIALTAYTRESDRIQALLAGFQQHISKPVCAEELIAVVATVVKSKT